MKILVLKGSGNKKGSSSLLADRFTQGATEAGHSVDTFDVIRADIRPCLGCGACGMAGACVQNDDYEFDLKQRIRECDMLVFAMPVYYYNWPAQLKSVVDRFYSFTYELTGMRKKAAMLSVAWDDNDAAFDVTKAYYRKICDYMKFESLGEVYGKGCGTVAMTAGTEYPQRAHDLGKNVK